MVLEKFYNLFLNKLRFSYDSFDSVVLNGYILLLPYLVIELPASGKYLARRC